MAKKRGVRKGYKYPKKSERSLGNMEYDLRFLYKHPDMVKDFSEKYGISQKEVESIIGHYFFSLKDVMTDWRMPKVVIPNVCTFKPKLGKINWWIQRQFYNYRLGHISREKISDRISKIWPIRQRLIKEDMYTKDSGPEEGTWREWRDYGPEYSKDFFNKD